MHVNKVKGCYSLFLVIGFVYASTIVAEPYYTTGESFTQSLVGDHLKSRAYLPPGYLLYGIKDRGRPDLTLRNGQEYYEVTTQDGARLYVLGNIISDKTLMEDYPGYQIIFNGREQLCFTPTCPEEYEPFNVQEGTFFKIRKEFPVYQSKITELKKYPKGPILYIRSHKLAEYRAKGIVTRTDRTHPRYEITSKRIEMFSGECGEGVGIKGKMVKVSPGDLEAVRKVEKGFDWGKLKKENFEFSEEVFPETENKQFEVKVYDVKDRGDCPKTPKEERFRIVAALEYECTRDRRYSISKPLSISRVVLFSDRFSDKIQLFADRGIFRSTPRQELVKLRLGGPFLFSINSYRQYEPVMEVLSQKLGNRSLAGFMMVEFGWSCSHRQRRPEGICWEYEYSNRGRDNLLNGKGQSG